MCVCVRECTKRIDKTFVLIWFEIELIEQNVTNSTNSTEWDSCVCVCVRWMRGSFHASTLYSAFLTHFPFVCHSFSLSLTHSCSSLLNKTLSNELTDQISLRMLHAGTHARTHTHLIRYTYILLYFIHVWHCSLSLARSVGMCVPLRIELTILIFPLFKRWTVHFNVHAMFLYCICSVCVFVCHWHNSILK